MRKAASNRSVAGRALGSLALGRHAIRVLAITTAVWGIPAVAQNAVSGGGTLKAVGMAPVSPGTTIEVVADEFTDVNTRLREVIEKAMAEHGYQVAESAPLKLSFESEFSDSALLESDQNEDANQLDRFDSGIEGGGDVPDCLASECEDLGRVPPYPTPPDQIDIPLGSEPPADGRAQYVLNFSVGEDGAPPLWQGSLTAALPRQDPFDVFTAMVPPLVAAVGTNVESSTVALGR